MRWFKHLSLAHEDEFLSQIIDQCGAAGYGAWWLIIEQIACQMDDTNRCFCCYSEAKWKQICCISSSKFNRFIEILKQNEKILIKTEIKCNKKYITIENPNLLKYKDEYTKKKAKISGQNPESVRTKSGGYVSLYTTNTLNNNYNNERERGAKQKTKKILDSHKLETEKKFDIFYTHYPLKKSKAAAKKVFLKINPDDQLFTKILEALEAQKKEREIQIKCGHEPTFWKHPSTWLNNECWNDEVDFSNALKTKNIKSIKTTSTDRFISSMQKISREGL